MAEYIEREEVLKHKRKMSGADFGGEFWDEAVLCEDIRKIPTADVVPVVRAAEILSDAFGNDYPCNFNNMDEWLPYLCEYANTCDCSSVKCWEQLIKHYGEKGGVQDE